MSGFTKFKVYGFLILHIVAAVYLFVRSVDRHGGARSSDFIGPIAFIITGIYHFRSDSRESTEQTHNGAA